MISERQNNKSDLCCVWRIVFCQVFLKPKNWFSDLAYINSVVAVLKSHFFDQNVFSTPVLRLRLALSVLDLFDQGNLNLTNKEKVIWKKFPKFSQKKFGQVVLCKMQNLKIANLLFS